MDRLSVHTQVKSNVIKFCAREKKMAMHMIEYGPDEELRGETSRYSMSAAVRGTKI